MAVRVTATREREQRFIDNLKEKAGASNEYSSFSEFVKSTLREKAIELGWI